jgi:hypothetical protein
MSDGHVIAHIVTFWVIKDDPRLYSLATSSTVRGTQSEPAVDHWQPFFSFPLLFVILRLLHNYRPPPPTGMHGQGSSVGIVTDYGMDGPEIESWWGEIFRACPDRP